MAGGESCAEPRRGLSADTNPVAGESQPQLAAARRRLIGDQLGLSQLRAPVWRERAVGGSGDGVLWNARLWCEEARHEVVVALSITPSRDDQTARLVLTQRVEIGIQPTHGRFVVDFDEVIEAPST